jgi:hypothetical protein
MEPQEERTKLGEPIGPQLLGQPRYVLAPWIGSEHLKFLEVEFLKPTFKNPRIRKSDGTPSRP